MYTLLLVKSQAEVEAEVAAAAAVWLVGELVVGAEDTLCDELVDDAPTPMLTLMMSDDPPTQFADATAHHLELMTRSLPMIADATVLMHAHLDFADAAVLMHDDVDRELPVNSELPMTVEPTTLIEAAAFLVPCQPSWVA